jgi:hypothetical protein
LDGVFAATRAAFGVAAFSLLCTALTLVLQRGIRGT